MNTQHVYNLDLDEIGENDNSVAVMPNTEILTSLAKQLSPLQSTFEIFRENQKWVAGIRNNLVSSFSEIAKRLTMPTESLMEAFRSTMKPTEQLRSHMVEMFKSARTLSIPHFEPPTLDIPEFDYDGTYEAPVILDIDIKRQIRTHLGRKDAALVKLPKNPKWEYLELVLMSDRDATVFYRGKKVGLFNCKELGMARLSTSDKQPDKKFVLLYHIALILHSKHTGILPTTNILATREKGANVATEKQLALLYQTKRLLSKQLKQTFGIDEEPIDYDLEHGYQPRFTLKFISELEVGLHEELPDPNTDELPEDLKDYQEPIE